MLPGAAREPGEPFTVGAFELYLVLAARVGPVEALDAVAGWGGDTAITYRSGQRSCVAVAAQGDTPEDDAQLRAAFEDWAAAGPANSARWPTVGNAVSLRSCQSTSEDDAAAVTTDPQALMLLDSRAFFTWQAMEIEGDGVDDALAQSDCLVRLPLETLATLVQTADHAGRRRGGPRRRPRTAAPATERSPTGPDPPGRGPQPSAVRESGDRCSLKNASVRCQASSAAVGS